MRLSIITVNYNNKDGLQKTISSIISQTYKDYEWIVIDGGSTDGSKELLEENRQHFSYWVSEPDKGVYNAMNKGLSHVRGEYVNFMNSGDVFYENTTLEKVFNESLEGDIVYGDWYLIKKGDFIFIPAPENVTLDFLYDRNICHQAMFIKSHFLKNEGYDESFNILADKVRWIKMILDGNTTQYVHHTICVFDKNGGLSSDPTNELFIYEIKRMRETFPSNIRFILEKNHQYRDILKEIEKGHITIEHLGFLNWHTNYLKFLDFRIKIGKYIKVFYQNIFDKNH